MNKYKKSDLSYLYSVNVVTGCFSNVEEALKHIFLIREIFSRFNFFGPLFYLGSEITSDKAFNELEKIKPFTLCLSLECFSNRKRILRERKARISLEAAKEILNKSKDKGFGTHFSYVLGLESLELILEKMEDLLPFINKLPVINIFQPHSPTQRKLLIHEACKLEYFLEDRKELEKIFYKKGFRPRTWGNYRCLWYLKFKDEYLDGPRLP
ncbi:MAG: hypothetical protein ACFFD2_01780 [Promethearchaeota archaeon]